MIKTWKITAQVNMCREDVREVTVQANSERKARMFAEEKLKQEGCFCIWIEDVKKL